MNQLSSGLGHLPPPPGLGHLPPGLDQLPPGLGQLPPGLGQLPPGLGQLPPGLGLLPPGLGQLPPPYDVSSRWEKGDLDETSSCSDQPLTLSPRHKPSLGCTQNIGQLGHPSLGQLSMGQPSLMGQFGEMGQPLTVDSSAMGGKSRMCAGIESFNRGLVFIQRRIYEVNWFFVGK